MSHVLSMTGFSSAILSVPLLVPSDAQAGTSSKSVSLQITVTLKSLNSRFFESTCKLPYALTHLETEIIKILKSKLHRGNIYFTLHMTNPHALTCVVEPSMGAIAGYISAIKHIQNNFNIAGQVTISDVIGLPHIFQTQDQQFDVTTTDFVLKAVNQLVDELYSTRLKEGEALAKDMHGRIANIRTALAKLEPRAIFVMEQKKQQILQNLEQLAQNAEENKNLELQKLTAYSQFEKLDIHEELVRFKTHAENLETTLNSKDIEKGKKLDFTLQELFREINTIASKCSDALISSLVIDIKVELEKAREQTQNIV